MVELAKKAGVSQATVSRVINGGRGVSPETARSVRQIVSDSGYRPSPRGRGTIGRGGGDSPLPWQTLALVFLDDSYLAHPELSLAKIRGVQQATADAGLNLVTLEALEGRPLPPMLTTGKIDGMLLWGGQMSDVVALPEGVPSLWLSSHREQRGDGVLQGNEAVGRIAAEYLLADGHRLAAFLNLQGTHPGYRARGDGFSYYFNHGGGRVLLVEEEPADPEAGQPWTDGTERRVSRLVDRFLSMTPRPTAAFIPDDKLTALAYRTLLQRGIRPEADVRLVSCNNEEALLLGLHPRPATIDLAPEITGRRAVEQLLWRIRHPGESRRVQVLVEPILVPGEGV